MKYRMVWIECLQESTTDSGHDRIRTLVARWQAAPRTTEAPTPPLRSDSSGSPHFAGI
jgi:hypothetical protein